MSFVGKAHLGPRGRNTVLQGTAQGYVADDHAYTRGPGAIAAVDAASPRRRQARMRQLAMDARRDAARARVAMGALPIVPRAVSQMVKKTVLPGMKIASAIRPGTVQTSKYPGVPGYNPVLFGAPGPQGVPMTGKIMGYAGPPGHPRTGKVFTYAGPQIFGVRGTGAMSPGQITIPNTPLPGTNLTPVDSGGGGGGSSDGSGGGGDGSQIDDGSSDLMPTNIDTSSPDSGDLSEPDSTVAQIASQTTPSLPPIPLDTTTPTTSNTTRNWLIAGAAILGAYWLFKKH